MIAIRYPGQTFLPEKATPSFDVHICIDGSEGTSEQFIIQLSAFESREAMDAERTAARWSVCFRKADYPDAFSTLTTAGTDGSSMMDALYNALLAMPEFADYVSVTE